MANSKVYCRTTAKDVLSFYIKHNNERYFLFSQNYKRGVHQYFANGVSLNKAIDYSGAKSDFSIERTMDKLPKYIKYIEKEYEISIFNQTDRIYKKSA